MRRHERLGHGNASRAEGPRRHDPIAQQRGHGIRIEQRGAGAVQVRRHAHGQVAPRLQHVQVVVQAHLGHVDQVVAEMDGVRGNAPLLEQADDGRHVAPVRERAAHQESDPHPTLLPSPRRREPGGSVSRRAADPRTSAPAAPTANAPHHTACHTALDLSDVTGASLRHRPGGRPTGRSPLLDGDGLDAGARKARTRSDRCPSARAGGSRARRNQATVT